MSQTDAMLTTLKRTLKQAGWTYGDVANALNMSESNVKRMFSTGRISLARFDQVCELIGYTIVDLARIHDESLHRLSSLTIEQEQFLVEDPVRLLVAVCVRNYWSMEDITGYFNISETRCIGYLAALDRLGFIELLPGNRVRLLMADDFRWIPGGPIQSRFEAGFQREFLDDDFTGNDRIRHYLGGSLSAGSAEELKRRILAVVSEFATLHRGDASIPAMDKKNYGLLLAMRPWEPKEFKRLRRKKG